MYLDLGLAVAGLALAAVLAGLASRLWSRDFTTSALTWLAACAALGVGASFAPAALAVLAG